MTLEPERKGRKASCVRSPRKVWDRRDGIPRMSLMDPCKRVLSVVLMPMTVAEAMGGVPKPAGWRSADLRWPRSSLRALYKLK